MRNDRQLNNKFLMEEEWRPAPPAISNLWPPEIAPVAIIVTCHNYGRFLGECLRSILSQSTPPCTVLVVDDDSDDDTANVCHQFPQIEYLHVKFRHVGRARRAGLQATTEPYVLFVDADNWLEEDYLEQGMKHFTDQTIAGVYADYIRFGTETGKSDFPPFSRGELFRRSFIDTCCLMRRDALELIDWVWDESPIIPEDHLRAQALAIEGWTFRKQPAVFHYRCHPQQASEQFRQEREQGGYAEQNGLTRWPLTLFIPLSGRAWAWDKLSEFLERQTYSHDRLQILFCDTSQNDEFSRSVRLWSSNCDYPDVRHLKFSPHRAGLADENRHDVQTERDVNLAMCRIYNRMRSEVQSELTWILEDDLIPPRNVLPRLLAYFNADVACVSAAYNSRYDGLPIAWHGDAVMNGGTPRCAPKRMGIERVRGTGFGCLLIRTELLRKHVFSLPPGVRYYDPEFFKQLGDQWVRLCDWSCWCKHLDPTKRIGYV